MFFYTPCPLIDQAPQNDITYIYNAYPRMWPQTYKYIYLYIHQTMWKAIIGIALRDIKANHIILLQVQVEIEFYSSIFLFKY